MERPVGHLVADVLLNQLDVCPNIVVKHEGVALALEVRVSPRPGKVPQAAGRVARSVVMGSARLGPRREALWVGSVARRANRRSRVDRPAR